MTKRRLLLESWAEPRLMVAMDKCSRGAAKDYQDGGLDRAKNFSLEEYREDIKETLGWLYRNAVRSVGKIVEDSIGKCFPLRKETKEIDVTMALLLEKFSKTAFDQAQQITLTMADNLKRIVEPLVQEGEGTAVITRAIRDEVSGMKTWQAQRIARTEVLMVTSEAQSEFVDGLDDMPPMGKEWLTSMSRARDDHKKMNDEKVPKDERFVLPNGDRMRYPGDRSDAKPENIVNCRCTYSFYPLEESEIETTTPRPATTTPTPTRLELDDVTQKVDLSGFKKDAQEDIQEALVDVFTKYGIEKKLSEVSDMPKGKYRGAEGIHISTTNWHKISIRKAYSKKYVEKEKETREIFAHNKEFRLKKLANLPETPRNMDAARVLRETERWTVSSDAKNPLKATVWHEAGHAVAYDKAIRSKFSKALAENDGWKEAHKVSQYASSSDDELFAEIIAAIEDGRSNIIPNSIMNAFKEVME